MASSPSLPFLQLSEFIYQAHRKLLKYFQSWASGGGECSVQPMGPSAPNTFEVNFLERAAKERVLKKREHQMVIDGKSVAIFLETTKKPVEEQRPKLLSVTQSLDEALSDEGPVYKSDGFIVQKVTVDRRAVTDATTAPVVTASALTVQQP